jgi:predicted metal-dependent enzyme (double-stranded beta helix superfamily)
MGMRSVGAGSVAGFRLVALGRKENSVPTFLADDRQGLRRICGLPKEPALRQAASFLSRLVQNPGFLGSQIPPLIEEAGDAEDWYVVSHDAEDGAYSLKIFVWPAGTGTEIHDHSSWGAYHCATGTLLEERYERLDEGSRPEHAHLKKAWQLTWSPDDGASTVLPGDGASTGSATSARARRSRSTATDHAWEM